MLELGFGVNAGPLSQIGVQIISIEKAVELAVGTYGWWKARERTLSLTTVLSSSGCHLVSTPSFSVDTYVRSRQNHHVRGTVVQNDNCQVAVCPHASTAMPAKDTGAALACLRALGSALLCLYSVDATVHILSEILPTNLLQHDQEDKEMSISGPFFTNLKASVQAIATEEDSNTFRVWLLNTAYQHEKMLFTSSEPSRIVMGLPQNSADTALAIGMLKWALTPIYRRGLKAYVTKSLTVWVLAVLLKAVGFEVYASPNLLEDDQETDDWAQETGDLNASDQVMLTTSSYGTTDPFFSMYTPEVKSDALKPQLMPIQLIPFAAFKHLQHNRKGDSFDYICQAFVYVYRTVRSMAVEMRIGDEGAVFLIRDDSCDSNPKILSPFQRNIVNSWSPHLIKCAPITDAVSEYLPRSSSTGNWDEENLLAAYEAARRGTGSELYDDSLLVPLATIQALMLAVTYGMISHFLRYNGEKASELSEIAFSPNMLQKGRLGNLITLVSRVLDVHKGVESQHLGIYVQELVTGSTASRPGTNVVLGVQANGVNVLTDLVVRPSIDQFALSIHHVSIGQLLNVSLNDKGLVELSAQPYPRTRLLLSTMRSTSILGGFEDQESRQGFRVDLEPFWEEDSRLSVFRVRKNGSELAMLNWNSIRHHYTMNRYTDCTCGTNVKSLNLATRQKWTQICLTDLMPTGSGLFQTSVARRTLREVDPGGRVVVDARGSGPLQLAVIGILDSRELVLALDCVDCALKSVDRLSRGKDSIAMILVN